MLLDDLGGGAPLQQAQVLQEGVAFSLEARRRDVQHGAAADGDDGRVRADDVAIAGQRADARLESEAAVGDAARLDHLRAHEQHPRHHFLGAHVKAHPIARLERPRRVGEELERSIDEERGEERSGRRQDVTPLERRALHALEVDRGALTRLRRLDGPAMHLEPADLGLKAAGEDFRPVVHAETSRHEGARDHGAEALHGEDAVDGQPRRLIGAPLGNAGRELGERPPQLGQPLPRLDGDGHDGAAREEGVREESRDVVLDQLDPVGLDEIRLGEGDHARLDAQELTDGEVLARLGHHALVGRDDEEREIDAAHPRQHVLDEPLVARYVHDLDGEAVRLFEEGEAEVDRYASRLLLGQPVGIGAGQRLDERGLAMIDVPRGAYDHMLRCCHRLLRIAARAGTSAGSTVRKSRSSRSSRRRPRTGGRAARSRSSRSSGRRSALPRARATVGSSTVGRAPPPTCEVTSTSTAPSRDWTSAESRRRSPRARRRIAAGGSVSIRSVGMVSSASPAS